MDWRRLVTDDANETDLLRSYAVRVTDATFGYEAEEAAAESGVTAADGDTAVRAAAASGVAEDCFRAKGYYSPAR
jgi:hypothetical protein